MGITVHTDPVSIGCRILIGTQWVNQKDQVGDQMEFCPSSPRNYSPGLMFLYLK